MKMPELPEANKVIDQLREIINGYSRRINGKILTRKEVVQHMKDMIDRRLG